MLECLLAYQEEMKADQEQMTAEMKAQQERMVATIGHLLRNDLSPVQKRWGPIRKR
jgi:predicted glycoside hydrolase/deacetylase ChbG (UPF0249 family)